MCLVHLLQCGHERENEMKLLISILIVQSTNEFIDGVRRIDRTLDVSQQRVLDRLQPVSFVGPRETLEERSIVIEENVQQVLIVGADARVRLVDGVSGGIETLSDRMG